MAEQGTEVNENSTSYTSVVSPQKQKKKKKKKKKEEEEKERKRKVKKGSGARLAVQKLLTFFQQKISEYCILDPLKQLTKWPLHELVKLTTLWTTGPCYPILISPSKHILLVFIRRASILTYSRPSMARTPMARLPWLIRTRFWVPTKFFR